MNGTRICGSTGGSVSAGSCKGAAVRGVGVDDSDQIRVVAQDPTVAQMFAELLKADYRGRAVGVGGAEELRVVASTEPLAIFLHRERGTGTAPRPGTVILLVHNIYSGTVDSIQTYAHRNHTRVAEIMLVDLTGVLPQLDAPRTVVFDGCRLGYEVLIKTMVAGIGHRATEPADDWGRQPSGRGQLSPRERQIMALVGRAYSNRRIAKELSIKEGTVKRHLQNIYAKLGASSRMEAFFIGFGSIDASTRAS